MRSKVNERSLERDASSADRGGDIGRIYDGRTNETAIRGMNAKRAHMDARLEFPTIRARIFCYRMSMSGKADGTENKYRAWPHAKVREIVSQELCDDQAKDGVSEMFQPTIRWDPRAQNQGRDVTTTRANGTYISLSRLGSSKTDHA